MSKHRALSRVSITIPADVLEVADRLAEQLDRSRSWVLSEGVRRMSANTGYGAVREPVVNPYAGQREEMEAARLRRLRADLALTPAERLRQAEEIAQLGRMVHPPRNRSQVIGFDSYEDYDRWKTTRRAGG
jgi:predicted transcriptional regulator